MTFKKAKRYTYKKNTIDAVVYQLRFPPILRIDNESPAQFQEAIRKTFPKFEETSEQQITIGLSNSQQMPPLNIGLSNLQQIPAQISSIPNISGLKKYSFVSDDDVWRISLTRNFISFSVSKKYTTWSNFLKKFSAPLEAFKTIYSPNSFLRVGLRYINILSKNEIENGNTPWKELVNPTFLSLLATHEPDIKNFNCTTEIKLKPNSCSRINISLGRKKNDIQELCLIFDNDTYSSGSISINKITDELNYLHEKSRNILEDFFTDKLRSSLGIKK